mgnify:CR=1 FL=1
MNKTVVGIMLCILMCTPTFADITAIIPEVPGVDATWAAVPLESLDLRNMSQEYGEPKAGKSIVDGPLTLGGRVFEHGVGSHAASELIIDLKGAAKAFIATVGVDDNTAGKGSVIFSIVVDGKTVARTAVMKGGDRPIELGVRLDGAKTMILSVEDAGDNISFDHADWADACIWLPMMADKAQYPQSVAHLEQEPMPIARTDNTRLSINYPRITGATPGRPFLFRIPATGREPLRFSAKGLPPGLTLDPDTGIITGALQSAGEWKVEVTVTENPSPTLPATGRGLPSGSSQLSSSPTLPVTGKGLSSSSPQPSPSSPLPVVGRGLSSSSPQPSSSSLLPTTGRGSSPQPSPSPWRGGPGRGSVAATLTIIGGNRKLALTPPMGWNSWYCWGRHITADIMMAHADKMVESGLAGHGYQYVNIDDCWEGGRDANGEIRSNERFPDMKAMSDYIHSKGLKFGIYSSPGPTTCGGYEGTYRHEVQDAKTYAKWGVDFFKHDWCSYGKIAKDHSISELQKPYMLMRMALDAADRDMVYSLCQYGMGNVWEWGELVGANMWRTTGDLLDSWSNMARIGFSTAEKGEYAGPGHWNDPDMLCIGKVGFGNLRPSKLTRNEQITQMTLWCLIAAPLLIGGDIMEMDDFTVDVLSNDEVIAVDQDPLGKAASRVWQEGDLEVWARPLADGTKAVGLFNRSNYKAKVTVRWSDIGLDFARPSGGEGSGVTGGLRLPVRDLWMRRDLGTFTDSFTAEVLPHAAWLIKVGRP